MQNGHSAFLGSEYVLVRDASTLAALRERYTTGSPISLHRLFPESMEAYAGERVRITGVSCYHMGFVLYEIREIGGSLINGYWPEEALEDQELVGIEEHAFFGLAADRYVARPSDDGKLVEIRDRADRLLCSLRMRDVPSAIEDINRVARLRGSLSFARRYNFEDDSSESHQGVDHSTALTNNSVPVEAGQ
jgi:hypothetical protein